jgi:hypothetical protein
MKIVCQNCHSSDFIEVSSTMKLEDFVNDFEHKYYTLICNKCKIYTELDGKDRIEQQKVIGEKNGSL